MIQTGIITKEKDSDFLAGALQLEVVMPKKDWRKYSPKREKQYDFSFDTKSCMTFSTLNSIEYWINYYIYKGLLSKEKIKYLENLGYIVDGEFNASDRFTAIMSGTKETGNYAQAVFDSVRNHGLLPEKDLPFGGSNWKEYHDKSLITQEMKDKALKIKEVFYWVYEKAEEDFSEALKFTPLTGCIPVPATHAVVLPSENYQFDTYPPYLFKRRKQVHYSYKFVTLINKMNTYKYFNPKTDPKVVGLKDELLSKLDKLREIVGFPLIITSGLRSKAENDALKDSASNSGHLRGYEVDISCPDSAKRDKIIEASYKVGITRRGIGKGFVHLGVDPSLPQNVMWDYYK